MECQTHNVLTSEVSVVLASLREQKLALVANLTQWQLSTYMQKICGIVAKVVTTMRDKQEHKLSVLCGTRIVHDSGATENLSDEGSSRGICRMVHK